MELGAWFVFFGVFRFLAYIEHVFTYLSDSYHTWIGINAFLFDKK